MVEERQDIIATLVKCAAELRELLERPSTRPQAACSGNGETCVSDRLSERKADQLIVNELTSISPAWPSTVALNVTV